MSRASRYFAPDFQTAQQRFRAAVAARGGALDSLPLAAAGPDGAPLSIDIAWFGAQFPRRVLVHSSGLHGVEGYAGSAIQLQWLEEGLPALADDAAIVIAHMLNPYGAAWLRRVNENNVDLNRNFRAAGPKHGEPARDYAALDALLNPRSPPRRDFFYGRAAALVLRHGMAKLRAVVVAGQTVNPRGLFYAGRSLEPGPAAYQAHLASRLARAEQITAIDVHTGLGRHGEDTLIVNPATAHAQANATMRGIYGARVAPADGHDSTYHADGSQQEMYGHVFSHANVHFATQEFGTLPPLRVLAALREENRWHHYGGGTLDHPAKRRLLAVFCPPSERWREQVLRRGREVAAQACGLAFEPPAADA